MKRLFSKKSGFTLVEIVIAFAVFAIMASMLIQVLNLTINRKNSNMKFDKTLQEQEKTLIAMGQQYTYDDSKDVDGTLNLQFKDKNGNDLPMDLDYQLKSVDGTTGEAGGINYFVGNITYAEGFEGSKYTPSEGEEDGSKDPSEAGGSSQMSRFDTRITGTKGINSIVISYTHNDAKDQYTISVTVNDSGVDAAVKDHSQVSLFFGEGASGGKMATVKSVTGNVLYVKKTGLSGVNIHCMGNGFGGSTTTFTVKFDAPVENLGFGDNASGNTYTPYKGYANIYGAYEKAAS